MTSHELASILLTLPDLPIAIFCNNHLAAKDNKFDIGILEHYLGSHLIIGNGVEYCKNKPNWYTTKILYP
jgi:hypothetical protein